MKAGEGWEGLVLVDKPEGPTSHDIVARARRSLSTRRIGHSGTLDPFASGLLILCVGRATRLVEYLHDLPKEYRATATLGVRTTTDDPEGDVTETSDEWSAIDRETVEAGLAAFEGAIEQRPPAYSAKKVKGEHAYAIARRGAEVELPAVRVTIERIELQGFAPPEVTFRVRCSTGTYIRSIARDLGDQLGIGAHLTELRRTAIGPFSVADALRLEELDDRERVAAAIRPPLDAVAHLPRFEVGGDDLVLLETGRPVMVGPAGDATHEGGAHAVTSGGDLVAVAVLEEGLLKPKKVFGSRATNE